MDPAGRCGHRARSAGHRVDSAGVSGCEVLAWEMLVRRCGSRGRAAGQVRDGGWQRVLRDAYVDGAQDAGSPEVGAAALQLLLPRGVALSHTAALWVLGLDVLHREVLDITGERGRHLAARPGVRVHIAALPDDQLVQVGGVYAVTTPARSSTWPAAAPCPTRSASRTLPFGRA